MADISYAYEAWMAVPPEDVQEGEIVLYSPPKRYRRDNPLPTVGVVVGVTEDDRDVMIDVKLSAARAVLMTAPKGFAMTRLRVYKKLGG